MEVSRFFSVPIHHNIPLCIPYNSAVHDEDSPIQSRSESYITTDWQPVSLFWCQHPSGAHDRNVITVRHLRVCWCEAPSLTREGVCRLQLLLVFASAIIFASDSSGTHDHILLTQIRDPPNVDGQVPVFISSKSRVAQLYPRHYVLSSSPPKIRISTRMVVVFEPTSTRATPTLSSCILFYTPLGVFAPWRLPCLLLDSLIQGRHTSPRGSFDNWAVLRGQTISMNISTLTFQGFIWQDRVSWNEDTDWALVQPRSCSFVLANRDVIWEEVRRIRFYNNKKKRKVTLSLQQAMEAHRLVKRRDSQIFQDNRPTDGGEVFSLTRRPLFTSGRSLVLISVIGWLDPMAIVRLEVLGQLKNRMTSSRI
jgi:hypothetical protein